MLIFIGIECPISNAYAPEVNRLRAAYENRRVKFYLVDVDVDVTAAEARKHAEAYGLTCPVILDPRHELAQALSIRVTPEAAVLGGAGALLYHGRIDDLYVSLGHRRFEPRSHDLRDAIEAVLDGRPVPNPVTPAVGCSIST